ncbi:MAG: hypothetical protein ACRDSH_07605 [Pseudonocardiaceae bacterium]
MSAGYPTPQCSALSVTSAENTEARLPMVRVAVDLLAAPDGVARAKATPRTGEVVTRALAAAALADRLVARPVPRICSGAHGLTRRWERGRAHQR